MIQELGCWQQTETAGTAAVGMRVCQKRCLQAVSTSLIEIPYYTWNIYFNQLPLHLFIYKMSLCTDELNQIKCSILSWSYLAKAQQESCVVSQVLHLGSNFCLPQKKYMQNLNLFNFGASSLLNSFCRLFLCYQHIIQVCEGPETAKHGHSDCLWLVEGKHLHSCMCFSSKIWGQFQ